MAPRRIDDIDNIHWQLVDIDVTANRALDVRLILFTWLIWLSSMRVTCDCTKQGAIFVQVAYVIRKGISSHSIYTWSTLERMSAIPITDEN